MKIAILGYGKEGQAIEKYFKSHEQNLECDIFENFTPEENAKRDYSHYDIIFRSPSVPPLGLPNESSVTKYFFDHCPCPIIGVTATKGKGTTCSFIKALLDAEGDDTYLVGNIGEPAINILDQLTKESVVVYELSSFQLWDLDKSPHIAIIGHLEPDHLNVHEDYDDYLNAKSNIIKHQSSDDYCIYFAENPESTRIANTSKAHKIPYPFAIPDNIKKAITLPGRHNQDDAIAAIAAVASFKNISPDAYLRDYEASIIAGVQSFHGLPHRLEFLRELNGVKYYDDNFATNVSSTRVAIEAFPKNAIVLILGGRDKTNYRDLPELYEIIKPLNVARVILIGESGHKLNENFHEPKYMLAESLEEAVKMAQLEAETLAAVGYSDHDVIVLMSPAAASFDMFENVYDRGAKYQKIIKKLQ